MKKLRYRSTLVAFSAGALALTACDTASKDGFTNVKLKLTEPTLPATAAQQLSLNGTEIVAWPLHLSVEANSDSGYQRNDEMTGDQFHLKVPVGELKLKAGFLAYALPDQSSDANKCLSGVSPENYFYAEATNALKVDQSSVAVTLSYGEFKKVQTKKIGLTVLSASAFSATNVPEAEFIDPVSKKPLRDPCTGNSLRVKGDSKGRIVFNLPLYGTAPNSVTLKVWTQDAYRFADISLADTTTTSEFFDFNFDKSSGKATSSLSKNDFDGDGISNEQEISNGTNPLIATAKPTVKVTTTDKVAHVVIDQGGQGVKQLLCKIVGVDTDFATCSNAFDRILDPGNYTIRVASIDADGYKNEEVSESFTTSVPTPTSTPTASPSATPEATAIATASPTASAGPLTPVGAFSLSNSAVYGTDSPSFSWTSSSGAASYNVKVSTVANCASTIDSAASHNGLAYAVNTTLTTGVYYICLHANPDASHSSDGSTDKFSSFIVDLNAPNVPASASFNTATATSATVTLSWGAVSDDYSNPVSYLIKVVKPNSTTSTLTTASTSTSVALDAGDGLYAADVAAKDNLSNTSGYSSSAQVTLDTTPPTAPANLRVQYNGSNLSPPYNINAVDTPNNALIGFAFDPSSDSGSGIQNYTLQFYSDGSCTTFAGQQTVSSAGPYAFAGDPAALLTAPSISAVDSTNSFKVVANDNAAHSTVSTCQVFYVHRQLPPAPTVFTVSSNVTPGQLVLAWDGTQPTGGATITAIKILRANGNPAPCSSNTGVVYNPAVPSWVSSFTDQNLDITNPTAYSYRLCYMSAYNSSEFTVMSNKPTGHIAFVSNTIGNVAFFTPPDTASYYDALEKADAQCSTEGVSAGANYGATTPAYWRAIIGDANTGAKQRLILGTGPSISVDNLNNLHTIVANSTLLFNSVLSNSIGYVRNGNPQPNTAILTGSLQDGSADSALDHSCFNWTAPGPSSTPTMGSTNTAQYNVVAASSANWFASPANSTSSEFTGLNCGTAASSARLYCVSQPYADLGQINVTANTSSNVAIDIHLPSNINGYGRVEVARVDGVQASAIPPTQDACFSASDATKNATTVTSFSSLTGGTILNFSENPTSLALANVVTYRFCVFDQSSGGKVIATKKRTVVLAHKRTLFATRAMRDGNLGGFTGADAFCTNQATVAGLVGPTNGWRAVISTLSTNANSPSRMNIGASEPIFTTTNLLIASGNSSLWTSALNNAPGYDEYGQAVPGGNVWTGSPAPGSAGTGSSNDCNGWGNSTGSYSSYIGNPSGTGAGIWQSMASSNNSLCNVQHHIYCMNMP